MHYVIYPDSLFLENLLCNGLLLLFLKSCYAPAAPTRKVLAAAVLAAAGSTLTSILLFRCHWLVQAAVMLPFAGVMTCYCMEQKDRRRIIFFLYQMMLCMLTAGGILQFVEQWMELSAGKTVLLVAGFAVIFGFMEKILSIYERQNACMREIVLYWDGKSCHFRGFADTGNQLMDPVSKKPVTMIAPDAWEILLENSPPPNYYLIPFRTVENAGGLIKGAQIDYMVILEGRDSRVIERPVVAIAEQPFGGLFHYSVLLHNEYC